MGDRAKSKRTAVALLRVGDCEMPLYDTVVLTTRPHSDAAGQMRPNARDRLIQEVVRQVLAWPYSKRVRVRRHLGPPLMNVAVVTRSSAGREK